jgi:hypothetical protein
VSIGKELKQVKVQLQLLPIPPKVGEQTGRNCLVYYETDSEENLLKSNKYFQRAFEDYYANPATSSQSGAGIVAIANSSSLLTSLPMFKEFATKLTPEPLGDNESDSSIPFRLGGPEPYVLSTQEPSGDQCIDCFKFETRSFKEKKLGEKGWVKKSWAGKSPPLLFLEAIDKVSSLTILQ